MHASQNERLTQVGPGTPMGDVLRRHWMPIAAVSEYSIGVIKPIRLMGENLVLYQDLSGGFGLIGRQCAHRRADLSYGFVEKCGLRCNYHGWAYDETGQCVEQPYEDTVAPEANYKAKIKIPAYPVKEMAGLLWTYMGPAPAPVLPRWEPFGWKNGFVQIVTAEVPCNWFQCQENSIDPVHFEWMHTNWSRRQKDINAALGPRHLNIAFDEFEHGLIYRRQREDVPPDHSMWTIGRVCLWPNAFFLGDHFEWRVPIDDENTLSVAWVFARVPSEQEPYVQGAIPAWRGPVTDPDTGLWITTHIMNQDFVAWVGQGRIADRTAEKLSMSDRGILMLRKLLLADMDAVARGDDPKGILRDADPDPDAYISLPVAERDFLVNGAPLAQMRRHPLFGPHLDHFVFQAGQPEHVLSAYRKAMGLGDG